MTHLTPQRFLKEVSNHKLTILRDDGAYRHIRLSESGTRCMQFDLITWPGYLCYTGDMGTYVFTRTNDMFEFFRRPADDRWHRIDMRYWAEKCEGRDRSGITEFSEDKFTRRVMEHLVEWIRSHRDDTTRVQRRELWDSVVHEVINADGDSGGYRKQCAAHDFTHKVNNDLTFYFRDFWEVSVTEYTSRFVWCCYAMAWGIQQYDAAKAITAEGVAA